MRTGCRGSAESAWALKRVIKLMVHSIIALSVLVASASAAPAGARHPDPDRAIRECSAGLEQAAKGHPAEALGKMLEACKNLYVEPRCRDAWQKIAWVSPSEKAAKLSQMIDACRVAYCPILPAPRPAICQGKVEDATLGWGELQLAILSYDLGADRATALAQQLARLLETRRAAIVDVAASLPTSACSGELTLLLRQDGVWIETNTSARRFVATCNKTLDRAALTGELCVLGQSHDLSCSHGVTVGADADVAYALVVSALDAAQLAGFSDATLTDATALAGRLPAVPGKDELAPARCGRAADPCPARPDSRPTVELPAASAATLDRAPSITIDKRGISLGKRLLVRAADLAKQSDWKIQPLHDALIAEAQALDKSTLDYDEKAQLRGTVVVRADKSVDAALLKRVLQTAAGAGYSNVMFEAQ